MKETFFALLLAGPFVCWPTVGAQTPAPAPSKPDLNQLFQFQPSPGAGKPQFKLQMPKGKPFTLPQLNFVGPLPPAAAQGSDPGMILKPRHHEQQPSKPAQPGKIYPDLKIMPIQIAAL